MKVILVNPESLFFLLILYSYVMLKFYESFILCKITIAQAVARTSSADFFFPFFPCYHRLVQFTKKETFKLKLWTKGPVSQLLSQTFSCVLQFQQVDWFIFKLTFGANKRQII